MNLVGCLYYLYQWCTVKQISDNEIHLLIKYIKSVLWRVAKCLSYIEEARCLKVNQTGKGTCDLYPTDYTFSNLNTVCTQQQHQSLNQLTTQEIWVPNQLGFCYFVRLRTPSVLTLFGIYVTEDWKSRNRGHMWSFTSMTVRTATRNCNKFSYNRLHKRPALRMQALLCWYLPVFIIFISCKETTFEYVTTVTFHIRTPS